MATEVRTIIEHETLPITTKREADRPTITRSEAKRLKMIKSLPKNAFLWGHDSIKWSQFCGVIRVGDLTLEILPKIYGKEGDPGACRSALVQMLRTAGFMKLHRIDSALMNLQNYTVLDVFIQDLCEQIERELLQGKLRKYTMHEENLPVLRGKLLGGYQLRHNLAHKERLYCQYDELSEDVHVNQVIKLTLKTLVPLAQRRFAKGLLIRLLYVFDGISDISIKELQAQKTRFNRHEERYADIYRICRWFLKSLYQDVAVGKEQSFSLLFDMNRLFEAWVASVIKPAARESGLFVREQGPTKNLVHREGVGDLFQLRPDISLSNKKREATLIVDTKWKLLNKGESKLGIAQSDLYQMQAYANRYDIKRLVLAYPAQEGLDNYYDLQYLATDDLLLRVVTVDINRPDTASRIIEFISRPVEKGE
ncbi:MAG: restriction endonuclease [Candidatus Dadabacteria bacterium]|nr:restriction endonuclease [Candidatus Dadabacteria bacterium]